MADDSTGDWTLDTDGDGALGLDDLVGRLDSFQMLRHSEGSEADQVLSELGATSKVDREIILQLGAKRPLGHPERFEEAHSLAVRSLEVLDRNGHRSIPVPNLSFLSPIVQFLVQIVTQFIVRSYVGSAIDHMHRLYERREAASPADWEHLPMLTRARIHTERIRPGFKRSKLALPTFLFGGAILSPIIGVLQNMISNQISSDVWRGVTLTILFLLLSAASWILVHGSAVARRRINLTAKGPLVFVVADHWSRRTPTERHQQSVRRHLTHTHDCFARGRRPRPARRDLLTRPYSPLRLPRGPTPTLAQSSVADDALTCPNWLAVSPKVWPKSMRRSSATRRAGIRQTPRLGTRQALYGSPLATHQPKVSAPPNGRTRGCTTLSLGSEPRLANHGGLINLAMSGGRFTDVADRQIPVLNTMLDEPDLVTCVVGSNDLMWRVGRERVYEDAEHAVNRIPSGTLLSKLNGPGPRPARLNEIFDKGAETKDLALFNIWNWPSGRGALAGDRIHPSDLGYEYMAELAWNAVQTRLAL